LGAAICEALFGSAESRVYSEPDISFLI